MPPSAFQDTEISTHDLTKRSTNRLLSLLVFQLHFNSRPHEEVDFGRLAPRTNALNFNSRPHEEVDQAACTERCNQSHFNSRPHEEVDFIAFAAFAGSKHFNSRPHEEVDWIICRRIVWKEISTHDLTKRSTNDELTDDDLLGISTHDLTKRSTGTKLGVYPAFCISTHDLTKRSTAQRVVDAMVGEFQLTTSRRGRQSTADAVQEIYDISTHDLTKRSTDCVFVWGYCKNHFNSRPHEEVDGSVLVLDFLCVHISTHDLTKRSTALLC